MKPRVFLLANRLNNQSGNTMVLLMIGLVAMSTAFYFLADSVLLSKKRQVITGELLDRQMSLNSVVDYLIYGVRNNYCFGETLLHEQASCNFQHQRSTQRLIMDAYTEDQIIDMLKTGRWVDIINGISTPKPAPLNWRNSGIRLNDISGTVDLLLLMITIFIKKF